MGRHQVNQEPSIAIHQVLLIWMVISYIICLIGMMELIVDGLDLLILVKNVKHLIHGIKEMNIISE